MMKSADVQRKTILDTLKRARASEGRAEEPSRATSTGERDFMLQGIQTTLVDHADIDSDSDDDERDRAWSVRFEKDAEERSQQLAKLRLRTELAYRTSPVSFHKAEYPCYVMPVSTLKNLKSLPDHEEALGLGLLQVLKAGSRVPNSASSYFIAHNWEGVDGLAADNSESTKLQFLQVSRGWPTRLMRPVAILPLPPPPPNTRARTHAHTRRISTRTWRSTAAARFGCGSTSSLCRPVRESGSRRPRATCSMAAAARVFVARPAKRRCTTPSRRPTPVFRRMTPTASPRRPGRRPPAAAAAGPSPTIRPTEGLTRNRRDIWPPFARESGSCG